MGNCNVSHILDRSSHQRCSVRKGVLRNFSKCTGKHRVRVSSLIKLQALGRWYRRVTANFAKFFKNIFFQNTSGSLVLFRLNRISDIMQESSIFVNTISRQQNFIRIYIEYIIVIPLLFLVQNLKMANLLSSLFGCSYKIDKKVER